MLVVWHPYLLKVVPAAESSGEVGGVLSIKKKKEKSRLCISTKYYATFCIN